jgi:serine phosphatase RsbU (regulator of sigma subunit)
MTEPSPPPSGQGPLLEAFQEIGRSLEIGRTAETILAGLRHILPACDRATLCALGLDGETVTCRRTRGRESVPPGLPASDPEGLSETGIARRVVDSGRPEILAVTAAIADSDPELDSGSASAVATPLLGAGGRRIGALVAESVTPSAFSERDRAALVSYAAGAAPALERILFHEKAVEGRELVSEMEVAGRVLHDLLPHECPVLEGMEVAAVYEPSSQVGGDYYDLIPLGEDRWGFAMADVAGKGIPAALLVAALHASVFSLAKSSLTLRVIVGRTNQLLYESVRETRYATFFFGLLDVPLRRLIHINAGHPPPILVRANGDVEMMHASGLPLGLFPSPRYFEEVIQLGEGDLLAFYTDGITESTDQQGDLFGRERLAEVLRRERDLGTPAAEVCDSVLKAVRRFRRGAPDDDQTVVVIRAR